VALSLKLLSLLVRLKAARRVAIPGTTRRSGSSPALHVGSSCHVTSAAYSWERGGRITQLQYLLQLYLRTSENHQKAKFAESLFHALG
jgi:hypothetical protein